MTSREAILASCGDRNISSSIDCSGVDDVCDDDGKFDEHPYTRLRWLKFTKLGAGDGDDGGARKILDGVLSRIASMFG